MIKRYSIVLLLFLILSCKSKEEKMFFDFDSVEYYSLNKNKEKEIVENYNKDFVFEKILYTEFPKELNNEEFLKAINSDGFSRHKILEKDIKSLNENVFVEKFSPSVFQYEKACIPEYRDILVFRKKNKITGIAKICLSCEQYYLSSSKKNIQTENFGSDGEFESLKNLFKTYKKPLN